MTLVSFWAVLQVYSWSFCIVALSLTNLESWDVEVSWNHSDCIDASWSIVQPFDISFLKSHPKPSYWFQRFLNEDLWFRKWLQFSKQSDWDQEKLIEWILSSNVFSITNSCKDLSTRSYFHHSCCIVFFWFFPQWLTDHTSIPQCTTLFNFRGTSQILDQRRFLEQQRSQTKYFKILN